MAWVPNSEITSASRRWQCGHAGSCSRAGSGLLLSRGGRKPLLLQAAQHPERALIDGAGPGAPAPLIPSFPVGRHFRRRGLESLFEPRAQLGRSHAQRAFLVERGSVAVRRPEPLERFAPGLVERALLDS